MNPFDPELKNTKWGEISLDFKKINGIAQHYIDKKTENIETLSDYSGASKESDDFNELFFSRGWAPEQKTYLCVQNDSLDKEAQPIVDLLAMQDVEVRMFVQLPGHFLPLHFDPYDSYLARHDCEPEVVTRFVIFTEDWELGHHLLLGTSVIHQWKAGDIYEIPRGMWHCSGNLGLTPKLTINITGRT